MLMHEGFGLTWLIVAVIAVVPFWRICKRIGYSPWISLLILVPLANVILVYFIAFSDWPALKTAASAAASGTPPTAPPGA